MSGLDPARREELAQALAGVPGFAVPLAGSETADALAPLIARWLADARAEGAAEVRARVEALAKAAASLGASDDYTVLAVGITDLRVALADPTEGPS